MNNTLFPFAMWPNNRLRKSAEGEPGGFPSRLQDAQTVGDLPGSTGPVKVDHQGQSFVRKEGKTPGHINEEMAASAAYNYIGKKIPQLGISVPEFRHYRDPQTKYGSAMLSRFIPNAQEIGSLPYDDPKLHASVKKQIQRGFAVDALLGNWDVIGNGEGNVIVDANGKAHRIDTGGSLRYRAQGKPKSSGQYGASLGDFWSMRGHEGPIGKNRQLRTHLYDTDLGNLFDQYHAISDHLLTPEGKIDPGLAKVLSEHAENPDELVSLVEDRLKGVRAMSQHVKDRQKQGMSDRDIDAEMKEKFWPEARDFEYAKSLTAKAYFSGVSFPRRKR